MSLEAWDDTAVIDVQSIQEDSARFLGREHGVLAWFGHHTREWWALVDGWVLVGARCPEQLGRAIVEARGRNVAASSQSRGGAES